MNENKTTENDKLLIDIKEVARLLSIPVSTAYEFNYTGKLPMPIKLGKGLRWRIDEVIAWVDAGAPGREKWNAIKN